MSRIKARVVHQGRSQGRNEAVETEAPLFILLSFSSLRRNFFKGLMFFLCWLLWNYVSYDLNLWIYLCYLLNMPFSEDKKFSSLLSFYLEVPCIDQRRALYVSGFYVFDLLNTWSFSRGVWENVDNFYQWCTSCVTSPFIFFDLFING
jgi:hypothetical protein